MKSLIKYLLLVALLIFHVSSGAMMSTQMTTSSMKTSSPELSMSETSVEVIGNSADKPCPHHADNMSSNTITSNLTVEKQSMTGCHSFDCSSCTCVNVVSSPVAIDQTLENIQLKSALAVSFIPSVFPESPLSAILRPPIS